MGFKTYHITLIFLILLLVISATLLGWALSSSRIHLAILLGHWHYSGSWSCSFCKLTRYNREVLFFFRALENDDTSIKYRSSHRNKFIDELHQHLNRVNESFQDLKLSE